MTMQMQIEKAIEAQSITKKQADEMVKRKKDMQIVGPYCITVSGAAAVSPSYYIRD